MLSRSEASKENLPEPTRKNESRLVLKRNAATAGSGLRDVSNLIQSSKGNNLPVIKQIKKEQSLSIIVSKQISEETMLLEEKKVEKVLNDKKMKEKNIEDIDLCDKDYPEYCSEYASDVYGYLHTIELNRAVKHNYMDDQKDITPKMRAILIDWLIDVHLRFKLTQETLYLTVSLIDRFLNTVNISRDKLQLVGVTCMLIASKFEEIYAPEINDFVYITDDAYSKDQILEMERMILNKIDFKVSSAYPLHFLRRASKAADSDSRTHTMAKYLIELSLPYTELLRYLPSILAASALCLARMMLHSGPWTSTIEHYTTYSESQLHECVHRIFSLAKNAKTSQFKAIHKKYSSGRFLCISQLADSQIENAQYST